MKFYNENHKYRTSNTTPPPSNALITIHQKKISKISIYFFKILGILFYFGTGVFLYGGLDIFLVEKDLKLVGLLFISSILSGFFGWVFNSVSKSFQKENELNKYIYLTLTPTEIIYQYLETNHELNRLVIPLYRFLDINFHANDDFHFMKLRYLSPEGNIQTLDIEYFFCGDDEWGNLKKLLEKNKEGISVTITPSEIIYKYIIKDTKEEKSVSINRNHIERIENCGKKPDDYPGTPAIIIYRDVDNEIKILKIEYEFVVEGLCKALENKTKTIFLKRNTGEDIFVDE